MRHRTKGATDLYVESGPVDWIGDRANQACHLSQL